MPNTQGSAGGLKSTERPIVGDSRRAGHMPAWLQRIGDPVVKELAVFVHSLGGGE